MAAGSGQTIAPAAPMSLQRRLLLIVLIGAPLVWLLALAIGLWRAQHEINELFDTEQVRLALQVVALLPASAGQPGAPRAGPEPIAAQPGARTAAQPVPEQGGQPDSGTPPDARGDARLGYDETGDMSVAAWDGAGRSMYSDPDGPRLPHRPGVTGFVDIGESGDRWRVYYHGTVPTGGSVAVGQRIGERDELILDLMLSQTGPWLLMLALLLPVLYLGVRKTMAPIVALARNIETRPSSDLRPLPLQGLPSELQPLVASINQLFGRITESIEHDRRFTADAAHELRTPLAATRAQWEVATGSPDQQQRAAASANVRQGLDRMSQLVSQLLALARLDTVRVASFEHRIDWGDAIAQALPDVLALADDRAIEIDVQWEVPPALVLPVVGNPELITAAIRNLLDNAVRYTAAGSRVSVVCETDGVSILDEGPGVPQALLPRLGDRFFRAGGQETSGSGLGLSIVHRIARLHGLNLRLSNRAGGGFCATLRRGKLPH